MIFIQVEKNCVIEKDLNEDKENLEEIEKKIS